jgi:peptidoglycan/xylan/chitin deacetylase (PgdA/CDA1 family)
MRLHLIIALVLLTGWALPGCSLSPGVPPRPVSSTSPALSEPTPSPQPMITSTLLTHTPTRSHPTVTSLPSPTFTPTSTTTATPGPTPIPPEGFTTRLLRPNVLPQAYLKDQCEYLRLRWSLEGSSPDTIVVPLMFHGIRDAGKPIPSGDNVTVAEENFLSFVRYAKQLGFQTITSTQLVDFLLHNSRIPQRSMITIVDDRNIGTVEKHFIPVLKENGWTLTMAWIASDTYESLWKRVETVNETGLVDIQSHGFYHHYIQENTPEKEIRQEIFDPIPVLEEHFGHRPIAFIWPGGDFTPLSVQIAREASYQIGFTANSNGPLLFNWIPLKEKDRAVNDPLMVLPRFWSTEANLALDTSLKYAQQAREFAIQNYVQEAAWYRAACNGELPALEQILPETKTPTPKH